VLDAALGAIDAPLARGGLLTRAAGAAGAVDGRAGTWLGRSAGVVAVELSCGGLLSRVVVPADDGVGGVRFGRSAVDCEPSGGLLRRAPEVAAPLNGLCCDAPERAEGAVDVLCGIPLLCEAGAVDVLCGVSLARAEGATDVLCGVALLDAAAAVDGLGEASAVEVLSDVSLTRALGATDGLSGVSLPLAADTADGT